MRFCRHCGYTDRGVRFATTPTFKVTVSSKNWDKIQRFPQIFNSFRDAYSFAHKTAKPIDGHYVVECFENGKFMETAAAGEFVNGQHRRRSRY